MTVTSCASPRPSYDVIVEPRRSRYTIFAQADGSLGLRARHARAATGWKRRSALDAAVSHERHGDGARSMENMRITARRCGHTPRLPHGRHAHAQPNTSLDDPGAGLRDNGRRVLTYADLPRSADRSTHASRDARSSCTSPVTWNASSGRSTAASSPSPPLRFTYGERLRISLINDTMMTHPIHLHGMWSEVEAIRCVPRPQAHSGVQPASEFATR